MITKDRRKGFEAALTDNNLFYNKNICLFTNSIEETKKEFLKILEQPEIPDAVFAMTDDLLLGVIQAIRQKGSLEVGKDIAVIGISNGCVPFYVHPNITHIKHSGTEVGTKAATYLMDLINHPTMTHNLPKIETPLMLLDSC